MGLCASDSAYLFLSHSTSGVSRCEDRHLRVLNFFELSAAAQPIGLHLYTQLSNRIKEHKIVTIYLYLSIIISNKRI